jgi:chromatin segregation and condensation protein Rec8/ScpA/Scc1 (kleisin family)
MTTLQQLIDPGYEVRLPVFEGPLDLLLYLVEKNELAPREISISAITDQYLAYLETLQQTDLANAGEFLVMASRLMRLKARELLPADQKDELEEMEYQLDRQALIAQMLEYQKFKEAARSLRSIEAKHFGAFPRGRSEKPGAVGTSGESFSDADQEAGVYDLLAAFRSVLLQKPFIPVHEVEIDDVTIEDRMQHVETELLENSRILFDDLFLNDPRRMARVVTFMAVLELCKLDRIELRQNHILGSIWVHSKQDMPSGPETETHIDPLPEFKPGLVEWVQDQIRKRTARTALDEVLFQLEQELRSEGSEMPASPLEALAAATLDPSGPGESSADSENEDFS